MASHAKNDPNRILNPLFLLEQAQLLRYAHFAILCEEAALPEDLLSDQLTILSDLRQESEKRLATSPAEASQEEIRQVLNLFAKDP